MFRIRNKKFKTIILRGSPLEKGENIGYSLRKEIRQLLSRDGKRLRGARKNHRALIGFLFKKLSKLFPDHTTELRGMALGAKVAFQDLFIENCPELLNKEDGCTSAAISNRRSSFIIHNEDEISEKPMLGAAVVNYSRNDKNYSGFAYAGELAGNAFGWGDDWFYSVNFLPVKKPDLRGVPRYFAARKILESGNIDAAIKNLRSLSEASGFHYLMGDVSGKIASVEKRLRSIGIKSVGQKFCHSNHYIHPKFKNLETIRTKSSIARLLTAERSASSELDQRGMLRVWLTELKRPLNKEDGSKTFATVLADLKNKTIVIN